MGALTGGVGRQARRMASELECNDGYLCSGRVGCMAKWGCLLFMDIILTAWQVNPQTLRKSAGKVRAPVPLASLRRLQPRRLAARRRRPRGGLLLLLLLLLRSPLPAARRSLEPRRASPLLQEL